MLGIIRCPQRPRNGIFFPWEVPPDHTKMKRIREMWQRAVMTAKTAAAPIPLCKPPKESPRRKGSWHRQHREAHCRDVRKMSRPRLLPTRARRKSAWAESLRIRAPLETLCRSAKRTGNVRMQRPGKSHAPDRCEDQNRSLHCFRARISSSPGHHRC